MNKYSLQTGQHKDLSDVVSNISPKKTPFLTMIGSRKVNNPHFFWTEEQLDPVDINNAAAEGADFVDGVSNYLTERDGYTQILTKNVSLSGTSQFDYLAGHTERMAHQVYLKAESMKRDLESILLGGQATSRVGDTGKLGSLQSQIDASLVMDKASASIVKADLDQLSLQLLEAGAQPTVVLCHPALAKVISNLYQAERVYRDIGNGTKVEDYVEVFHNGYFTLKIVQDLFMKYDPTTQVGDIAIIDPSMWQLAQYRPWQTIEIAKTGDADRREILVECGLVNKNFFGSGIITNVKVG
ncbi:SU10 major capsid protein [Citrobacter farmeri]|uniref:SU10 major capsid protein n=1 Tax=Citrobacter farmeri TaxID=67824 RepID=UPI0018FF4ABD|nr:DUF5309 family protein [Citrobacter farmeri]MBJ9134428.1 DUF5309 family protein [Citrobacter farmeri]